MSTIYQVTYRKNNRLYTSRFVARNTAEALQIKAQYRKELGHQCMVIVLVDYCIVAR